jgi:Zn-dependent protease
MDFNIILIVMDIVVILFAVSIHEASHGYAAYRFGDPTPEVQGRLTLNPIAHLDLVGSIIIPFFLVISHLPVFGWAKPVMIDPRNFKGDYNQVRKKTAWVALAGPGSNFIVATVSGLLLRLIFLSNPQIKYFVYTRTNISSSPLVGLAFILFELFVINTFLGLFNLIPIPPLDGGNIVSGFLPPKAAYTFDKIRPFGFFILLILLFTNLYSYFIMPVFKLFLIIPG